MKQYILIRTDKKFAVGKIMAHCAHNSLTAYLNSTVNDLMSPRMWDWYYHDDQKKIVVRGGDLNRITTICAQAGGEGIPFSFLTDVITKQKICAVVGPVSDEESYHLGLADLPLYR